MQAQKDFKEFCSLLNTKRVEFLIVGGYAVAFHGAPRFTGDLDILIHPLPEQIERMLEALQAFGFSTQGVSAEYILQQPRILQLGRVPVQIHIMTRITGVAWESAWASRQPGFYGDVPVFYIGKQDLIANKRAVGRMKDLADIEALGGLIPPGATP